MQLRRNMHEIRKPKGRRFDPPFVGGPVAFDWPHSEAVQARKRRIYAQARGKQFKPPWVGGPVAFAWSPAHRLQAKMRRLYRPSRGRILHVPQIIAPILSTWTAPFISERRYKLGRRTTSGYIDVPALQAQAPRLIGRRRYVILQAKRDRMQDTAWLTVAVPPPVTVWTPVNIRPKLLRYAYQRRGRLFAPPVAEAPTVFVWRPDFISERRLRAVTSRRPRRPEFPLQQLLSVQFVTARRQRAVSIKRGRVSTPPWVQVLVQASTWTPGMSQRRTRTALQKRGRRTDVPMIGAALNAFAWLPKQMPRRLRTMSMLARRGRRSDVVRSQTVAPTTVWTPQLTGRRARILVSKKRSVRYDVLQGQELPKQAIRRQARSSYTRRVRRIQVVPDQLIPVQVIARAQRHAVQIRRPFVQRVVLLISRVVPFHITSRPRQRFLSLRRGKRFDFNPVILQPSVWRPGIVRSRWAKGFHRRRQMFGTFVVHNVSRIFPVITTGETDRPEGGTTDRGQSGETENSSRGDVL